MACDAETETEIEELKEDLVAIRAAIRAILNGAQSYRLDTSQTAQTVTRADLGSLRLMRRDLTEELKNLQAQCSGAGVTRVVPSW